MNTSIFQPVKGLESNILNMPKEDGYIYFATDTGHIYIDNKEQRILVGGGQGATIYYAFSSTIEQNKQLYWVIERSDLENSEILCSLGDIIINEDGSFYKISYIPEDNSQELWCDRIAIAGSGDGSTNLTKKIDVKIVSPTTTNLVNGQSFSVTVTPTSAYDSTGNIQDEKVYVVWSLSEKNNNGNYIQYYEEETPGVVSGDSIEIEIGSRMKSNSTIKLMVYAYGINSGQSIIRSIDFTTSTLSLTAHSNFSNAYLFNANNVIIWCNVEGNTEKLLYYYWDDELLEDMPLVLAADADIAQSYKISNATHGRHTIKIELYQSINKKEGLKIGELNYEIAVDNGEKYPIIWLQEYKNQYYDYENIQILYQVYDPQNKTAIVNLYKDNKEIVGSPKEITRDSQNPSFELWEITDASTSVKNSYRILCDSKYDDEIYTTSYEIEFEVEETNKLKLAYPEQMVLNFDAIGRTNSESATNRTTWVNDVSSEGYNYTGSFSNFNWKNNGWITDDKQKTGLRISNGALFDINFSEISLEEQSWTFELEFKISNLSDYSNLVTTYTKYSGDKDWWERFENQSEYSNYDLYLREKENQDLDSLIATGTRKITNTTNAVCSYYDTKTKKGFCIGPQDAFFSTGENIVNVNYIEDEVINLAIVYDHLTKFISIYLNGILTGIELSTISTSFTIGADTISFNSNICDINLYKMRIYNTSLAINYIVQNFATDKKDIDIYEQTNLAVSNSTLQELQFSYSEMLKYNDSHKGNELMPYVIWTTKEDQALPFSKSNTVQASMEFHNVALDRAYAEGLLLDYAKQDGLDEETCQKEHNMSMDQYYYMHHCPSWHGDNIEMKVQGTSSEFYPRRNYKIKTKVKDDEQSKKYVHMYMNSGPFADQEEQLKWFYYDNYTVGTTKFTMKIDFMESSGTYNMGFANLVNNAYVKHPLDDYADAIVKEDPKETSDYQEGVIYTYYNHKGNKKDADGTEDNLIITSKEDFDLGPYKLYQKLMEENPTLYTILKVIDDTDTEHYNKWYVAGYKKAEIENTQDYRTSTQGFPVLAFHKQGENGTPKYIGRYNMILDKGSDEAYGFAIEDVYQQYVDKKELADVAECWEFSDNVGTFCSFRDPENRKELSFTTNEQKAAKGGPLVIDSFEYRYHKQGDDLDTAYNLDEATEEALIEFTQNTKIDITREDGSISSTTQENVDNWIIKIMSNWEKACAWVYSTCTDHVISEMKYYKKIKLGDTLYKSDSYYIYEDNEYQLDSSEECDPNKTYYQYDNEKEQYTQIYVYNSDENKQPFQYEKNKYYIQNDENTYILFTETFNEEYEYYVAIKLDEDELSKKADLLVSPAQGEFNGNTTYYSYNKSVKVNPTGTTGAVTQVENPTSEEFEQNLYYVKEPVIYNGIEYAYDTKEYRLAKFQNELKKHFNIDYVATYFVMTEVFECFDSRGKNCMMASWGPQEEGGDYIWYPIFYDIDTQLGINNTGIPSFTSDMDVTQDQCFSTHNNILWNNFYACYKNSYIRQKYRQLRGYSSGVGSFTKLGDKAPLQSIDKIEKWYLADPDECGRGVSRTAVTNPFLAMKGERPLIALNLDEYYKYITITNTKEGGGYAGQAAGEWVYDIDNGGNPAGSYFYALQGDRKFYRQQFLTNRLSYIDSWLSCGAFQRGESSNIIWGRISANISDQFPDFWYGDDYDYFQENGEKTHEYDAEFWINLTFDRPVYTAIGFDNTVLKDLSQKYKNEAVKITFPNNIKNSIISVKNYKQQLFYIYGTSQIVDLGDMSKLYWSEFHLPDTGCNKLKRLLLGNDGFTNESSEEDIQKRGYYRTNMEVLSFKKMPLLEELCLSGIETNESSVTYDLSGSEKLKSFRALRTDINSVNFADGVALHTLYLPDTITSLNLNQAKQLTKLLTYYPVKKDEEEQSYQCDKGLYIENLFDTTNSSTNINKITLEEDALRYDSFRLLNKIAQLRLDKNQKLSITMKSVNWCPYKKLDEGTVYDPNEEYFKDNKHYGLEEYNDDNYTYDKDTWELDILNGQLYKKDLEYTNETNNQIDNLNDLTTLDFFKKLEKFSPLPTITGIVYINNNEDNKINEEDIYAYEEIYPGLQFIVNEINKGYNAEFRMQNKDKSYSIIDTQRLSSSKIETSWFDNPSNKYSPTKLDYDFIGWSLTPMNDDNFVPLNMIGTYDETENKWIISDDDWTTVKTNNYNLEQHDYIFYAIFKIHEYTVTFYDGDETSVLGEPQKVAYGTQGVIAPEVVPWKDDSKLDLTQTYGFKGWRLKNSSTGKTVELSNQIIRDDTEYIPVFEEISVYDNIHYDYFTTGPSFSDGGIVLKLNKSVRGKITIPGKFPEKNGKIVKGLDYSFSSSIKDNNNENYLGKGDNITHVFFDNNAKNTIQYFSDYTFYKLASLIYIEIPSSLQEINYRCFSNCSSLYIANGTFGENLTSVGQFAFNGCSIRNYYKEGSPVVFFPSTIKSLSENSFYNPLDTDTLQFGTKDSPIKKDFLPAENKTVFKAAANRSMNIKIYTDTYTKEDITKCCSGNITLSVNS